LADEALNHAETKYFRIAFKYQGNPPNQIAKLRAFEVIKSAKDGSLNAPDTLSKTYA
jgi:hypothetical protein